MYSYFCCLPRSQFGFLIGSNKIQILGSSLNLQGRYPEIDRRFGEKVIQTEAERRRRGAAVFQAYKNRMYLSMHLSIYASIYLSMYVRYLGISRELDCV